MKLKTIIGYCRVCGDEGESNMAADDECPMQAFEAFDVRANSNWMNGFAHS